MRSFLNKLRSPKAQGMVEYALILVLVALVVIFLLLTLGAQTKNLFSNVIVGLGS